MFIRRAGAQLRGADRAVDLQDGGPARDLPRHRPAQQPGLQADPPHPQPGGQGQAGGERDKQTAAHAQ